MMKIIFSLVLLVPFGAAAQAAVPAGFTLGLTRAEAGIMALQGRLRELQNASLPSDIEAADQNVGTLIQQANQLREYLGEIRGQVQVNPVPNPSVRAELDQVLSDLNIVNENTQYVESQVQNLAARAQAQPDAVSPAQNLENDASQFQSYGQWLYNEILMDAPTFSSAGYSMEGSQLQFYGPQIMSGAQNLQSLAQQLLSKVQ